MKKQIIEVVGQLCPECTRELQKELRHLGAEIEMVRLKTITLPEDAGLAPLTTELLGKQGIEPVADYRQRLLTLAKQLVDQAFEQAAAGETILTLARNIPEQLSVSYGYLDTLFLLTDRVSFEHYLGQKQLDKAKEWLVYTSWSVTEVALRAGFDNVQQLSAGLLISTGLSPLHFRQIRQEKNSRSTEAGRSSTVHEGSVPLGGV